VSDQRLEKLADVLVNYSTTIRPDDWVLITGDVIALPMLRAIYRSVLRAGGNPSLMMSDERMTRNFLRNANEDQMNWINPGQMLFFEKGDAYIAVNSSNNTRAMTHIDPRRMQQVQAARRPITETYLRRSAEGNLRWVLTLFPTEASAQEANLSLEEYEDFVYGATFCDQDDPVAEWRKMSDIQQSKIDWLKGKKQVELIGPNIDLHLSIAERIFINADGSRNMPDGEIFTGPVEDSVNGWVRFSYPSIVGDGLCRALNCTSRMGKL
jgi:aminopeptidase